VRGFYDSYERETQPKRFWASMVWNGLFAAFFLWIAFMGLRDASKKAVQDRCYNQHGKFSSQDTFDACTQLIEGKARLGYLSRADAFVYRAISEERSNRDQAITDYTQAIRLQPDDGDAYFNRGLLLLNSGRPDDAVPDFSRAHELNAKNIWPLANRGLAYALMEDSSHAEADFRVVEASDKSNPVMLRGRAVLSINSLNMTQAVNYLTASLKSDPDNVWAVRTRAWVYRQLGDDEHADADIMRYERLSGRRAFFKVPSR
jgi:Tfp pilus assembly protein PilF